VSPTAVFGPQLVRHAVPVLLHWSPPAQGVVDKLHKPEPLQLPVVSCPLLQDGAKHVVPVPG
jgi:hypothetical protein